MTERLGPFVCRLREHLALRIAPWLMTEAQARSELELLAKVCYGELPWTSRTALVKQAVWVIRNSWRTRDKWLRAVGYPECKDG